MLDRGADTSPALEPRNGAGEAGAAPVRRCPPTTARVACRTYAAARPAACLGWCRVRHSAPAPAHSSVAAASSAHVVVPAPVTGIVPQDVAAVSLAIMASVSPVLFQMLTSTVRTVLSGKANLAWTVPVSLDITGIGFPVGLSTLPLARLVASR